MRTLTEVGEGTLGIGCDRAVLEVLLDMLYLISLSLSAELLHCISLGNLTAYHSLVLTGKFEHLVFYLLEVALLNHLSIREEYIIEEAILDSRTETELYAGEQLLQSFCKEVGRGMPEGMLSLFILEAIEVYLCILIDGTIQFCCLTINTTCYAVAGKSR